MESKRADEQARECVTDPLPLMVKYLDGKPELTNDEREILLFALYAESRTNKGLAASAILRLRQAAGEGTKP